MPNEHGPAMRAFTNISKVPFGYLRRLGHNSVVYVDDSHLEGETHGYIIPEEFSFIKGHDLEKSGTALKGQKFKVMTDKKAYIYRESIAYLFANID